MVSPDGIYASCHFDFLCAEVHFHLNPTGSLDFSWIFSSHPNNYVESGNNLLLEGGMYQEIDIIIIIISSSSLILLIIKITISSIVIGLRNSYFSLIHLPSCYRTVCYWTVQQANHIQSCSLNQPITFKVVV